MWIDTHCHLDAHEFAGEQPGIVSRAMQQGVSWIIVPAVELANFKAVSALAQQHAGCAYALGIHPLYVPHAPEESLQQLRTAVNEAMKDPRFIAIGEIGLDFFVPELVSGKLREKQEFFYSEQLKIARDFGLPVLLHVRRSQDVILKYLRRIGTVGGIAHAFNGSFQQAHAFIALGFKLGFGGAMTFPRALQIRRLAVDLPVQAIVLETDAPDIPPVWLARGRNSPDQLPRIAAELASMRCETLEAVAQHTSGNAVSALPRLGSLIACNA